MTDVRRENQPNQAEPVTLLQLREALAFVTDQYDNLVDGSKNVFVWLWEALQGDFNQQRSTGQVAFDAAISIIPGVDQVCDVRDIIANCKEINKDSSNSWAWVGLVLTLIGLFPSLGSVVKGVLKIFFLYVRRFGMNHVVQAVDAAIGVVVMFLRRREVARYWRHLRWDRVFHELAVQVRAVRNMISPARVIAAFDRGIALMRNLLKWVADIPFIGTGPKAIVDMVVGVRGMITGWTEEALKPVYLIFDTIIRRLEFEDLLQRRAIMNSGNVHFRGALPEAHSIALMRRADPPPAWLSSGAPKNNKPLDPDIERDHVKVAADDKDFPALSDGQIESFAIGMTRVTLNGPMKLFRIISPSNSAAGSDWFSEEVFNAFMKSPDPKAMWRKNLAVWPDWNPDSQFVIYELKAGESLNVYRGPASAQVKSPGAGSPGLPDYHLEGGMEQIKFDASIAYDANGKIPRSADTKPLKTSGDDMSYYDVDQSSGALSPNRSMTYDIWKRLPASDQVKCVGVRDKINNPRITGPYDTNWGSTDFDVQIDNVKLGLPNLPGQRTGA